MKKLSIVFWFALLIFSCSQKKQIVPDLAIVNTTVIDVADGKVKPEMTVLIKNNTITSIKHSRATELSPNTKVVDGKGKFLIPGLWDMHVHTWDDSLLFPLMIVNGVTSIRDMMTNPEQYNHLKDCKQQISENKRLGPNLYIPITIVGGDQENWGNCFVINSEKEAVIAVREAKKLNADFIKVFDLYDSLAFIALLKEARLNGISVAGHCPIAFNIANASESGMNCFEHLFGVELGASSLEAELRKKLIKESQECKNSFQDLVRLLYFVQAPEMINSYDSIKAKQLFIKLKKSGSYQCPDLILWDGWLKVGNTEPSNDKRIEYIPKQYFKAWNRLDSNYMSAKVSKSDMDITRQLTLKRFELVKELNKYKIPILAGTDVTWNNPYNFPGFGLHDELSLLVKAGLTPMEALQSATINAATYLGVMNKTGTIEVGKIADLVLLNANPLENINNTTKINAVFKAGRYFPREELNSILLEVKKSVDQRNINY